MAAIVTNEDFRLAATEYLRANNITGATPLPAERKIMSAQNVDITPSTPVLEAALDTALANKAEEDAIRDARAALTRVRVYLRNQLMSSTPHNPQQLVSNIKPEVDGNVKLTQMMTNQLAITNPIMGWAVTLNPSTLDERRKYIQVVEWIAGATPNEG